MKPSPKSGLKVPKLYWYSKPMSAPPIGSVACRVTRFLSWVPEAISWVPYAWNAVVPSIRLAW